MSQEQMDDESLFDEGFDVGNDEPATDDNTQAYEDSQENNPEQQEDSSPAPAPAQQLQQQTLFQEQSVPQYQPAPQMQQQQPQVKEVDIPDEIKSEFEELEKANPQAAKLAREDSQEGEAIRQRLASYGADLASDKAAVIVDQRQRRMAAEQEQMQRVQLYQQTFQNEVRKAHPDYFAMRNDPSRAAEAQKYHQEMAAWIEEQPYKLGRQLAEAADHGTYEQVNQLLTMFENARNGKKAASRRPDPTGALAVPGRGAPVAPSGLGDKDSFEDGWNINESEG